MWTDDQPESRDYQWGLNEAAPWHPKYPTWASGSELWAALDAEPISDLLDKLIKKRHGRKIRPKRPCVFVSHRRADVGFALRIAYLACQAGFNYWLDVLDPTLATLPQNAAPYLVASVIEMGLLNSTHVLAVMTSNTAGSQWVPYEYGRAKEPVLVTSAAACWCSVQSPPATPLPEYLHLGTISNSEADVVNWLAGQYAAYSGVRPKVPCRWTGGGTAPLG